MGVEWNVTRSWCLAPWALWNVPVVLITCCCKELSSKWWHQVVNMGHHANVTADHLSRGDWCLLRGCAWFVRSAKSQNARLHELGAGWVSEGLSPWWGSNFHRKQLSLKGRSQGRWGGFLLDKVWGVGCLLWVAGYSSGSNALACSTKLQHPPF
jgi:hypothetical protein